jgi:polygalacturonase
MSRFLLPLLLLPAALCKDVLFGESGGIPTTSDLATAESNKALLEDLLASLSPGDSLTVENSTFIIQGGVHATGLTDVTLRIEGTLKFFDDIDSWPLMDEPDPYIANRDVQEALHFTDFQSVTLTGGGTIDGSGLAWWGFPGIGYLIRKENRPRLMVMDDCKDITIEHILFKDSAYWTTLFNNVDGLVIRHSEVSARRPWDNHDGQHNLYDLSALNTDGFDVTGRNVHIHDCKIWNQDDCIAVKDNYKGGVSENMLFERIEASGMGLVIGSSTWPPESTPAAPLTLSLLLARFARSLARSQSATLTFAISPSGTLL